MDTDCNRVVGYYASCSYLLDLDATALAFGVGKKRHPMPALLLVRLAVDVSFQQRGIAKRLVDHAFRTFAQISTLTGVEVVVVDAVNPDAVEFYVKFGFTAFAGHEMKLFLPTAVLRAAYGL